MGKYLTINDISFDVSIGNLYREASPLIGSFVIDQSDSSRAVQIKDENESLSQIVQDFRSKVKRYAGFTVTDSGEEKMCLCEIDEASQHLKDTSTLIPIGVDVWVKFPDIWFKGENSVDDASCYVQISLENVDGFKKFDGSHSLIAAYDTAYNGRYVSEKGRQQHKSFYRDTIDSEIATKNGSDKYSGLTIEWYNIIRLMYLAAYKNPDIAATIGSRNSTSVYPSNYTADSNIASAYNILFGITNAIQGQYLPKVTKPADVSNGSLSIQIAGTDTTRQVEYPYHTPNVSTGEEVVQIITKMSLGEFIDFIPIEVGDVVVASPGITVTTGWQDATSTYDPQGSEHYWTRPWVFQGGWESENAYRIGGYGIFSTVCNINEHDQNKKNGKTRMCYTGNLEMLTPEEFIDAWDNLDIPPISPEIDPGSDIDVIG